MGIEVYVTFLMIGVLLVVVDGAIIYRSGRRYLESSDAATGNSMVPLVTTLFHLAMLGVVALLSTIDFGTSVPYTTIMVKVGVLLLLLAVAHGIAMAVIARVRDEEIAAGPPRVVPGQRSAPAAQPLPRRGEPEVPASLEEQHQYRTDR